jgi:hypothetical protein
VDHLEPTFRQDNELRAEPRISLLMRAAKLVSPDGEFLCVLRDVSSQGAKVKLFHPVPTGGPFAIELGNGDRFRVEPVWEEGGHAGLCFTDGPVQLSEMIEEAGPFPKRHLRLKVDLSVTLQIEGQRLRGLLRDLSLHGALVETAEFVALRQLVTVVSEDFPARHARVRWRRGSSHGLVFHQGFRLDELAAVVAGLQSRAQPPAQERRINY